MLQTMLFWHPVIIELLIEKERGSRLYLSYKDGVVLQRCGNGRLAISHYQEAIKYYLNTGKNRSILEGLQFFSGNVELVFDCSNNSISYQHISCNHSVEKASYEVTPRMTGNVALAVTKYWVKHIFHKPHREERVKSATIIDFQHWRVARA